MKRFYSDFEYKVSSGEGAGSFEGLANAFFNVDSYGDIVCKGAFSESLPAFLKDGFIGGINHDWDEPIGKPTDAYEVENGLYIKAMLSKIDDAQNARTLMQEGILRKMSIGFRTLASEEVDGDGARAYWQSVGYTPTLQDQSNIEKALSWHGGLRLVKKASLIEVSPVTMPANAQADIVAVKGDGGCGQFCTEREFEEFLRDAGFSRKSAQCVISEGYRTLLRDAGGEKEPEIRSEPIQIVDPAEVQAAISFYIERELTRRGV